MATPDGSSAVIFGYAALLGACDGADVPAKP